MGVLALFLRHIHVPVYRGKYNHHTEPNGKLAECHTRIQR